MISLFICSTRNVKMFLSQLSEIKKKQLFLSSFEYAGVVLLFVSILHNLVCVTNKTCRNMRKDNLSST